MAKKRLKAVLALVVAMMFVFQTVPMYSFAEQANQDNAATAEQTVSEQTVGTADNQDETELNYAIDENGNKVELTDEMREEIYSGDDESTVELDEETSVNDNPDLKGFFEYDESEIELASQDIMPKDAASFDSTDGWILTSVSKSGKPLKAVTEVVEKDGDKVLKLVKNKNDGIKNGNYNSGDEAVYAVYDLGANKIGGNTAIISADVNVERAGRLGLFFYGETDDINANLSTPTDTIPYLGRTYYWNNGSDPETASLKGIISWNGPDKVQDTEFSAAKTNKWYTFRFEVNPEAGSYSFQLIDKATGSVIKENKDLAFQSESRVIQGIGFTIQNDVKTLGSAYFDNVQVINANDDSMKAANDKDALNTGIQTEWVTGDFDLPVSGTNYQSAITWESSNTSCVSVDVNGHATVTRPDPSESAEKKVTLTATITNGFATAKKNFVVKVLANVPDTDEAKAEADKSIVSLPDGVSQTSVNKDFTLKLDGPFGSKVTYASSNEAVAAIDNSTGKVTITTPAFTGKGEQIITIIATITNGSATVTKEIPITVKENPPVTDQDKAAYIANNVLIGGIDINNVRQNFWLDDEFGFTDSQNPDNNFSGTLTWSTNDTSYLNITRGYKTEGGDNSDEGNDDNEVITGTEGYNVEVTRPGRNENNVTVTLTVTATVNGATAENSFTLTIIAEDALKAYPGVEGYGAYSKGGRGGQVYHVTNLNHDGEGSLTYGLEQVKGARNIVFDVAGVIDLTDLGRPISIKGEKLSNVTVAGQTAPYPGITLKGYGITVSGAHDVIIRNIKIRIGDVFETGAYNQSDPLSIGNAKQVVIDHCTLQWAVDMAFRATGEYITMSNSIFGKSILGNSPHEKGGHAYIGMINEGARKVTYAKNFIGDSTQRSPRITDADWIDSYNCVLYNSGNGYDLFNYEWMNKNAKMNVYNNYARMGPSVSNSTPYRAGRGRNYAGGIMAYFKNNYTGNAKETPKSVDTASISEDYREDDYNQEHSKVKTIEKILNFGSDNASAGEDYDLSNVTLDEWNSNPLSSDNKGKKTNAATLTYMNYPFPAPRGEVLDVVGTDGSVPLVDYALDPDDGMGATKPARDIYDAMCMKELKLGGTYKKNNLWTLNITMKESEVSPYFTELERRTGMDFSEYKSQRDWYVVQGAGPILKGSVVPKSTNSDGSVKEWTFDPHPVHWDDYTDVNVNTNPNANEKYDERYTTNFEVGDWWGEYCGSPGQRTTYTLEDKITGTIFTTTDADYDHTRYELISEGKEYIQVNRTVADLFPDEWVKERDERHGTNIAEYMEKYRKKNYPYTGNMDNPEDDIAYTSKKIVWDSMNDGIPNWFKEYMGWSTTQQVASLIDEETGYTYLELYFQFMADDEPLATDDTPATIENFKVNNVGYSTAQVFWNTDFRTACVLEYGTEPGKYTNQVVLSYDETTDYYHTYHAQTLIELEPDTQYYYKVTAIDENSQKTEAEYDPNDSNTKNMTFKTEPAPSNLADPPNAPTITDVVPYLNQVRLNWTGDPGTTESYEIYYDTVNHGKNYELYANKIIGLDALNYKQIVTGLENGDPDSADGSLYYFVVVARNGNGGTASEPVSATPSSRLFKFDFTTMSEEERNDFMTEQFMYVLGGAVTMQKDPDTGQYVLQMLDETNSHGVNMDLKFPMTQDKKFTYKVKLKVLYQKQTDALNGVYYRGKGENGSTQNLYTATGSDEHNTIQLNFYKDILPSEDMDSTNSALWESAFSIYFDSESSPISKKEVDTGAGKVWRFDGTTEKGTLKYQSTNVGSYVSGTTIPCQPDTTESTSTLSKQSRDKNKDVEIGNGVIPYGTGGDSRKGTGYLLSKYDYNSPYGDAILTNKWESGKTLHSLWYYEKGSAKFVEYKIVADPVANNVKIYADDVLIYGSGIFSEDMEEPYNVGKVQIKSRNDGYSWVNVASIEAYTGDGKENQNVKPVPPGTVASTGGSSGGPGVDNNPAASATPAPSGKPGPSEAPTAAPINPNTNKYFDDLGSVDWAVDSINALAEKGIVTGTGDRQFSPNANVTRAEFATMLMRAFGSDVAAADVQFSDVAAGEWYYEPIAKAITLGVVKGYDDGTFGINDNISREDMMVMAYRATNAIKLAVPKIKDYENFSDQDMISDYAIEAIESMYCAGIINGVGNNLLDPKGNADRAQSAKIIYGLTNMEGTVNE